MMRESKTRALTAWQHLNKCYTTYRTAYGEVRRLNSQIPQLFTAGHVQDALRFLGSLLDRMKSLTVNLGVVNENRTYTTSLEGWSSTIEPHQRILRSPPSSALRCNTKLCNFDTVCFEPINKWTSFRARIRCDFIHEQAHIHVGKFRNRVEFVIDFVKV